MHCKLVLRIGVMVALGTAFFLQNDPARAQVPGAVEIVGQQNRGFALNAGIALTPFAIEDHSLRFPTLAGVIGLGYKIDRFVITGTFDFTRTGQTNYTNLSGSIISVNQSVYSLLVGPDLQVALARSADLRAELICGAAVLLGTRDRHTTISPNPNPTPPNNEPMPILFRWRVGPGVRYWMHPNIAFSALVGMSGMHHVRASSDGGSSSMTSIYSQFGLTGVF